jgi:hypothetical protein
MKTRSSVSAKSSENNGKPNPTIQSTLQKIIILLIAGVVFGFAMEKSKVYLPIVILSQMKVV